MLSCKNDDLRPLTKTGIKQFKRSIRPIVALEPQLKLILTSPLVRAEATAQLLKAGWPREIKVHREAALKPQTQPLKLLRRLALHTRKVPSLALVGHEPDLGQFMAFCLGINKTAPGVEIKKGAVCILEFSGRLAKGKAKLLCLIPPRILRRSNL